MLFTEQNTEVLVEDRETRREKQKKIETEREREKERGRDSYWRHKSQDKTSGAGDCLGQTGRGLSLYTSFSIYIQPFSFYKPLSEPAMTSPFTR
jgi:hypothetical protein